MPCLACVRPWVQLSVLKTKLKKIQREGHSRSFTDFNIDFKIENMDYRHKRSSLIEENVPNTISSDKQGHSMNTLRKSRQVFERRNHYASTGG